MTRPVRSVANRNLSRELLLKHSICYCSLSNAVRDTLHCGGLDGTSAGFPCSSHGGLDAKQTWMERETTFLQDKAPETSRETTTLLTQEGQNLTQLLLLTGSDKLQQTIPESHFERILFIAS